MNSSRTPNDAIPAKMQQNSITGNFPVEKEINDLLSINTWNYANLIQAEAAHN